ncbi:MAG: single-stranded DNA-binding protein [Paludibacteraceae bacterium]|nr:single-stranded DNA-binding protein [Paludibacteraceae bacterium]
MGSVNKVILIGNVGTDPEVKYLDRGIALATFRMCTSEPGYTQPNGTEVPERVEWHSIVLWRNQAEWAEQFLRKGMKIYVEGKLQTRRWEHDGVARQKTEIVGENIQVLYRPDPAVSQHASTESASSTAAEGASELPDFITGKSTSIF